MTLLHVRTPLIRHRGHVVGYVPDPLIGRLRCDGSHLQVVKLKELLCTTPFLSLFANAKYKLLRRDYRARFHTTSPTDPRHIFRPPVYGTTNQPTAYPLPTNLSPQSSSIRSSAGAQSKYWYPSHQSW